MERGSGGGGSLELAGGGGGGGGNTDLCLQDLVTGSTAGLSVQHHQHSAAAASMAGLHGDHLQGTMHHHDLHGNSHHDASMLHNSNHQLHEPLEKLKRGESVTISRGGKEGRVLHQGFRFLFSRNFRSFPSFLFFFFFSLETAGRNEENARHVRRSLGLGSRRMKDYYPTGFPVVLGLRGRTSYPE